jgi:hypothetical protein
MPRTFNFRSLHLVLAASLFAALPIHLANADTGDSSSDYSTEDESQIQRVETGIFGSAISGSDGAHGTLGVDLTYRFRRETATDSSNTQTGNGDMVLSSQFGMTPGKTVVGKARFDGAGGWLSYGVNVIESDTERHRFLEGSIGARSYFDEGKGHIGLMVTPIGGQSSRITDQLNARTAADVVARIPLGTARLDAHAGLGLLWGGDGTGSTANVGGSLLWDFAKVGENSKAYLRLEAAYERSNYPHGDDATPDAPQASFAGMATVGIAL